ncbi:MAG: transcription elongation factor GreA [Alphaproteobacteria bacterium]|nr:transcription elongation factor GreA [Alphaproteobacteria bacterium]MDA7984347.1 transcription elongation factor GreA [Alphaproteobacteria bacterium]MDA7987238.1 transcription elongation factor GreA [Alphaproteobacteria bacterium]MDA7988648.1 transcription elongation factor GreA [Alphaproteobacteria bacterium]MDA8001262.1 transcription elongation factor GreA [Alphaproteobacteria bacterium]
MQRVPITKEGYERLRLELRELKTVTRGELIDAIAAARAHGDLSENAEYHAAREKQSFVEGRIRELESLLGRAEVIDVSSLSGDVVRFGAEVSVSDEDSGEESLWRIVGDAEADASAGRIGVASPMARALIGRGVGDVVEVRTPRGERAYKVLSVRYG